MYIALLDDSESRHREINLLLGEEHCLLEAFEVEECKKFFGVEGIKVGLLLVDHDLGLSADGDDFAKWMMDECGRIMRYLAQHEGDLTNEPPRGEMRGILIRNKDLLNKVLAKLPVGRPALTIEKGVD